MLLNHRFFSKKNLKKLLKYKKLKSKTDFITTHSRPFFSKDVTTFSDKLTNSIPIAIVLQGAVVKENDFTLETTRIYQKLFPNTKIILSTWNDEDKKYLAFFTKENVEIVLSEKSSNPGISNVNLQIISSKNGIQKAKNLGYEYVLKTRTDQRMYSPNIKEFLFNILKTFPLKNNIKIQKHRLIGVSLNTFKYRLYGVSDMFLFGHIDDMILYWSPDHDNRYLAEVDEKHKKSIKDFCECRLCEVYFATEFLKKIDVKFDFTLYNSWKIYAEHFCIIDKESLDLFWPKYNNLEYRWLRYEPFPLEELTFREWLNLYCGLNNKSTENIYNL